jgi:hypothetical protein
MEKRRVANLAAACTVLLAFGFLVEQANARVDLGYISEGTLKSKCKRAGGVFGASQRRQYLRLHR